MNIPDDQWAELRKISDDHNKKIDEEISNLEDEISKLKEHKNRMIKLDKEIINKIKKQKQGDK